MPELIIAEHHDQVYSVWKERGYRNLNVTHVDFHCDMRGLLIDRDEGTAVFTSEKETEFVDRGNFLAHAIMDGFVSELKWVHGPQAGRAYDFGPVVQYESDLLAPFHRFRHRRSDRGAVRLKFSQQLMSDWTGLGPGQQLDLDWDALASIEYSETRQQELINQFLNMPITAVPEVSFLVYSPGYSNPDRNLFYNFADELAHKFGATITELPKTELITDGETFGAIRRLIPKPVKDVKRGLVRRLRKWETAGDLSYYKA